jgi:predicted nucleic acid-binding protein
MSFNFDNCKKEKQDLCDKNIPKNIVSGEEMCIAIQKEQTKIKLAAEKTARNKAWTDALVVLSGIVGIAVVVATGGAAIPIMIGIGAIEGIEAKNMLKDMLSGKFGVDATS